MEHVSKAFKMEFKMETEVRVTRIDRGKKIQTSYTILAPYVCSLSLSLSFSREFHRIHRGVIRKKKKKNDSSTNGTKRRVKLIGCDREEIDILFLARNQRYTFHEKHSTDL